MLMVSLPRALAVSTPCAKPRLRVLYSLGAILVLLIVLAGCDPLTFNPPSGLFFAKQEKKPVEAKNNTSTDGTVEKVQFNSEEHFKLIKGESNCEGFLLKAKEANHCTVTIEANPYLAGQKATLSFINTLGNVGYEVKS
jgi:hypothetical protein